MKSEIYIQRSDASQPYYGRWLAREKCNSLMPLSPPLQNTASPQELEPDASDLNKIKKWQEDRKARKLRGEYESAVHHLSVIVCVVSNTDCTRRINTRCRSIVI